MRQLLSELPNEGVEAPRGGGLGGGEAGTDGIRRCAEGRKRSRLCGSAGSNTCKQGGMSTACQHPGRMEESRQLGLKEGRGGGEADVTALAHDERRGALETRGGGGGGDGGRPVCGGAVDGHRSVAMGMGPMMASSGVSHHVKASA